MIAVGSPFFYIAVILPAFVFFIPVKCRKKWIVIAAWNLIILFFLLSFADTALNLLIRPEYNDFRVDSPFYHHGMYPLMNSLGKWEPGYEHNIYPVKTNSLGFRDIKRREVLLKTDRKRAVLIGDSFTEGVGCSFEETFAGIIYEHFKEHDIEILNAAAVSYSPKLYYLKMKYFIEKRGLELDHLYLFLDVSDIQDEVVYEYFSPGEPSNKLFHAVSRFFFKHSYIYMKLKLRYNYIQKNPYHERSSFWGGVDRFYKLKSEWTLNEKEFERWGEKGLDLALKYMDKLHRLLEKNNITLHLSIHPWPDQIFSRQLESVHVESWRDFCSKRDVEFINLFPLFINEKNTRKVYRNYFIDGDVHWNAEGHELVADHIIPLMERTILK